MMLAFFEKFSWAPVSMRNDRTAIDGDGVAYVAAA